MLFMLFLIMLIPYLGIGMLTERHRYAVEAHQYNQLEQGVEYYQQMYDEAKKNFDAIPHKHYCFYESISKSRYDCQNCTDQNSKDFKTYKGQMTYAKKMMKQVPEPSTNPLVIVGWPVYGAGHWLKSGTVEPSVMEISNETRILQLEKELEIR